MTTIAPLPSLSRTSPTFAAELDTFFLTQLPATVTSFNTVAGEINTNAITASTAATTATDKAAEAVVSASTASTQSGIAQAAALSAVNAPGTSGTSTSSLSLTAGTKTFATQASKAWVVGQPVNITRTSDPASRMYGLISSYNSGTGAMSVAVSIAADVTGIGTFSDWTISLVGPKGNPTSLPSRVGNALKSLRVNAAETAEEWAPASASAITLIGTINAVTAASVDFTGLDTMGATRLMIIGERLTATGTGNVINGSMKVNGAWVASAHVYCGGARDFTSPTETGFNSVTAASIPLCYVLLPGRLGPQLTINIHDPNKSRHINWSAIGTDAAVNHSFRHGAAFGGGMAAGLNEGLEGLRLTTPSGTISGVFRLFGYINV